MFKIHSHRLSAKICLVHLMRVIGFELNMGSKNIKNSEHILKSQTFKICQKRKKNRPIRLIRSEFEKKVL